MTGSSSNSPNWIVKIDVHEQAKIQTKLGNSEGHHQNKDKKPKQQKYVRARAKLPQGPEAQQYKLPDWVVEDNFKVMMLTMLKTISNTQQRMRIMEAVVADNFMVPSTVPAVAAGVAMAEAYHRKAISGSKEDLGPPGPQVLYAFSQTLMTQDIGAVFKEEIKTNIIDKINTTPQEQCSEFAAVFSIRPCYDTSYHKIVLVSSNAAVRSTIIKALSNVTDAKHYTAPAPPSGQEDEIQKWIEKLESL